MQATQLDKFKEAYAALVEGYYKSMNYDHAVEVELSEGKRYRRLTRDKSAVAFIDQNGDIYMAASYKAPAKHVRGNINSELNGMEAFGASGHVRYLR